MNVVSVLGEKEDGLNILILSGVHGNELTPLVCCELLCKQREDLSKVNFKKVTIISNINRYGIKNNVREIVSQQTTDINRMFNTYDDSNDLENIDGYTPETPVMIVGNISTGYTAKQREGFEFVNSITGSFTKTGQAMTYNDEFGSTTQWFISIVLSSNMVFIPADEIEQYKGLDSVINLQEFPDKNCYTWVGDILVFKINNG